MRTKFNKRKMALIFTLLLTLPIIFTGIPKSTTITTTAINLTAQTNKQTCYIREKITIQGEFTQDGQPITDGLIAMQIINPRGDDFAYRTITVGNPNETWPIEITQITIEDMDGNPITAATVDTVVRLKIRIENNLTNQLDGILAYTIYDNTLIPILTIAVQTSIPPANYITETRWLYIPEWATPGKAMISCNFYNKPPKDGGIPYIPEKLEYFYIVRNKETKPIYSTMPESYKITPGQYEIYVRLPPDKYTVFGQYQVFTVGRVSPILISSASTTFTLQSEPCPPQAAFTYYPLKPYANMTVTLDASSSSAEGYNDTIIRYEWTINDPYNPETIINEGTYTNPPSPLAYHTFEYGGTYTIALNVTDNEGLWSYTIKPITIYPEFGPTANFTWTPDPQIVNRTVTFNASSTQLGWSAKLKDFAQIQIYSWNFSDGTGIINTTQPIICHNFTQPGNYSVTLTVVDEVNRISTITKIVQILNASEVPWDVNGDRKVDMIDLWLVALAYGSYPGSPTWDPRADVNGDEKVDMIDIWLVALHFGEQY